MISKKQERFWLFYGVIVFLFLIVLIWYGFSSGFVYKSIFEDNPRYEKWCKNKCFENMMEYERYYDGSVNICYCKDVLTKETQQLTIDSDEAYNKYKWG